ncbi:hypothetical protein [Shewanella sp. HN-41]|uniref:hypothetical protein n=1 Tax=Shewanella sp. HN-41 TaxID=327275 RepID=UPI000212691F|nr:hypothetical protein [Shewanella sp. HN-41]EGM70943.1 hypothetical protein SOHN41_00677 [Shewanella sp. HN-41]
MKLSIATLIFVSVLMPSLIAVASEDDGAKKNNSDAQATVAHQDPAPMIVTYVDASDLKRNPNNVYFSSLLKLALEKSIERFGAYQLNPVNVDISQKRQLRELDKGSISVFWTMTSYAREADMLPVRVPLTKGMYGIRLMAINRADHDMFSAVSNVKQLAKWKALLGRDWPDTAIMRVNRLDVRSDVAEGDLYNVLDKYQGNYFPRAVTEIYSELDRRPELNIEADEHLGLVYPTAVYFLCLKLIQHLPSA